MKKVVALLATVTVLAGLGAWAWAGQNDKGPENVTVSGGVLGPVPMNHHLHQKAVDDCNACHDLFAQRAGAIDAAKKAGTLKKKEVMDACEACHEKDKKEGKPFGPVSCKGCHKK